MRAEPDLGAGVEAKDFFGEFGEGLDESPVEGHFSFLFVLFCSSLCGDGFYDVQLLFRQNFMAAVDTLVTNYRGVWYACFSLRLLRTSC